MWRDLANEVLRHWGYDVIQALDGASALALLREDERIELLLTGINMPPGMDGIELARRARASSTPLSRCGSSPAIRATVWSRGTGSAS